MLYIYTRAIGDRIAWKSGGTDGNCQFAQLLAETHRKIVAEAIYIRYISGIEVPAGRTGISSLRSNPIIAASWQRGIWLCVCWKEKQNP